MTQYADEVSMSNKKVQVGVNIHFKVKVDKNQLDSYYWPECDNAILKDVIKELQKKIKDETLEIDIIEY